MGDNGNGNLHISGGQGDTEQPKEIQGSGTKARTILKILVSEEGKILFQAENPVKNKQFLIDACLEVAKSLNKFKEPEMVIHAGKPPEFMNGLRRFLKK